MVSWSRVFVGTVGLLVATGAGRPAPAWAQERPRPESEKPPARGTAAATDRHAARREALERQRRGDAAVVRPRGGIAVGRSAARALDPVRPAGGAGFGAVSGGSGPEAAVGSGWWWGAWADGRPRDRRRYGRERGVAFPDAFGRGYPGAYAGATCIAYIPALGGRGPYGGSRPLYGPGVAILRHCVPSATFGGAAALGSGYEYGYPWGPFGGYPYHRFRDELRDDALDPIATGEGWRGAPTDPYLGAPVDAVDCAAVTLVIAGGRAYRGAVAPSAFGARDESELLLALDAELSEGRPIILYGPYGYPVRVPPGALVDDVVIERCAVPAG